MQGGTGSEAKKFIPKNIVLRLQAIFRETIAVFDLCDALNERVDFEELRN
jgi:hypothetical protein